MKKTILFILMLMMCWTMNVFANNVAYKESTNKADYDNLVKLNTGLPSINVTGTSSDVTLYGHSECANGSCIYKYSKTSSSYKEVLKQAVKCTNGEKYINIQTTSNDNIWYKSGKEGTEIITGNVAWSESFTVTCATSSGNGSNEELVTPTGQQQSTGGNTSTGNGSGNYGSSTTTPSETTGVETYYIILGIVGILTYFLTIVIKKQNLFKNV